jgi:hypothetical protein
MQIGNYVPIMSVDGIAPNRNAVIVDCWGASRNICEREDGRWHLPAAEDGGAVSEFVFA